MNQQYNEIHTRTLGLYDLKTCNSGVYYIGMRASTGSLTITALYKSTYLLTYLVTFSALTLLVGRQEGHLARKKYGGCWRWALVRPDGVASSRMVSVPLLIFPCTIKPRSSLLASAHPGGPGKTCHKTVVVVVVVTYLSTYLLT